VAAQYWTYDAMWRKLREWEREYPKRIRVEVAGASRQGRDIAFVTLTNWETGNPEAKPAVFVDANVHAGEVTGNAVAMHWMGWLLDEYGRDPEATRILDEHTVYVIPRIAVDGAEAYLTTPLRLRSSPHPYPETEPSTGWVLEDVDHNGLILTLRQESPDGGYKIDPQDPRLMVPREPDDVEGPFYHLYPEGRVDRRHQSGTRPLGPELKPARRMGMDFNRNFPVRWAGEAGQPGAGPYPLSEPETRAVVEAILARPNIAAYVALHTAGGVILRQPSLGDDNTLDAEDLGYFRQVGAMGERRSGYFCKSNFDAFATGRERAGLMPGAADDWAYETQGILAFTLEIWDLPRHAGARGYAEWGRRRLMALSAVERAEDARKIMDWVTKTVGPEAFHPWTAIDHPDLGRVEVGGLDPKFVVQNPPPALLADECRKVASFLSGLALAGPRLAAGPAVVESLGNGLFRVAVSVVNAGFLPTSATAKGRALPGVKPLTARLEGARVVGGESPQTLGHLAGYGRAGEGSRADQTAVVEWVVAGQSGQSVTVHVDGGRAGRLVVPIRLDAGIEVDVN
jgi:hypothetical protein